MPPESGSDSIGETTAPIADMVSMETKKIVPATWWGRPPFFSRTAAKPVAMPVQPALTCSASRPVVAARRANGASGLTSRCDMADHQSLEGFAPAAQPDGHSDEGGGDDQADPQSGR